MRTSNIKSLVDFKSVGQIAKHFDFGQSLVCSLQALSFLFRKKALPHFIRTPS